MNENIIELGKENDKSGTCEVVESDQETQVEVLKAQVSLLKKLLSEKNEKTEVAQKVEPKKKKLEYIKGKTTKEGVPIGIVLIGTTKKKEYPYILTVKEDGYYVGATQYNSLSAAAEAVSGVRRSGWTFWKTSENQTLKEALGK